MGLKRNLALLDIFYYFVQGAKKQMEKEGQQFYDVRHLELCFFFFQGDLKVFVFFFRGRQKKQEATIEAPVGDFIELGPPATPALWLLGFSR